VPVAHADIRRITVLSQPGEIVYKTLSQKYPPQKGLVEWLKVKALISSTSTEKKKKKKKDWDFEDRRY
jgi:hypothetical protein